MKLIISSLVVAGVLACSESPYSPSVSSADGRLSEATVPNPDEYVATTIGWVNRSCIAILPSGSVIDDKRKIATLPDRTERPLGTCQYPRFSQRPAALNGSAKHEEPPTFTGWVEFDSATQSTPNVYHRLTDRWVVPDAPTGSMPNGSGIVYYTFPGLENEAGPLSDFFINQTVLQYGQSGFGGGQYWSIVAFHYHDGGAYSVSNFVQVNPGDVLQADMSVTGCSNGECSWSLFVLDSNTNGQVDLGVAPDLDTYNFITGGAVEAWNVNACNQYPYNGVFYSNINAYDQNMTQVTPSWHTKIASGVSPSCSFAVNQVDVHTLKLYHNPEPGANVTSYSTNPSPPLLYNPWTLTLNGTGFDPSNVEMDFTQNCYPPNSISCPTGLFAGNGALTSKSSTQIVSPTRVFGTPGTLYIWTKNGDGGSASNYITITLPQR